jgi:hypothetical protein
MSWQPTPTAAQHSKTPRDLVNALVHPGQDPEPLLRHVTHNLAGKPAFGEVVDGLTRHLIGKDADKAARAAEALVGMGEESIAHLLMQI